MTDLIAMIVAALSAGAIAKTSDIGSQVVADAYDGLKMLVVDTLGKGGVVQCVEDEPRSETAQAVLAGALAKVDLTDDCEILKKARTLHSLLLSEQGVNSIEFGNIFAEANATIRNLNAAGRIRVGDVTSRTGDVTVSNLRAGGRSTKNV